MDRSTVSHFTPDNDPQETAEWIDALDYVIQSGGQPEYPGDREIEQRIKHVRHFSGIDPRLEALVELARKGKYPQAKLPAAIKTLGLDPNKPNPVEV